MEYLLDIEENSQMIEYDKKIVVIAGPTVSGKSNIALKLAKSINGYIINADSRQVYKDLNIGTAKPTPEERLEDGTWMIEGIEHYLYDIVSPKELFTVFEYQKEVQRILNKKKDSNQIPILVGGTGLYIDSIVFNYDLKPNTTTDTELSNLSIPELQELAKEYISDMNESDRNNRYRLIRVLQRGGINIKKGKPLKHIYIVLDVEKDVLRARVVSRVDEMFKNGLEEENKELLSKGYTYQDRALRSIGYQEFKEYFNGNISLEEVHEKIVTHTLQYAKRQRTWFRRNKHSVWTNDYQNIVDLVSNFITTE